MRPSAFLHGLWGDLPAGARIHIWELGSKRSSWLLSSGGADTWTGQPDVYTGVGIAAKDHGRRNRCPAHLVAGIAGLWLDLDVKPGSFDTIDQAASFAHTIAEPTILVDSGHGLHAWWLIDGGPWYFRGDRAAAATLAARWHVAHAAKAEARRIDPTHDLARILRIPGTINAKDGERAPVTLLAHRGPRHAREYLEQLVESVTLPTLPAAVPQGVQATLTVPPTGGLHPDRLAALLESDPDLRDIFEHRTELGSMSEHDLSLCTRLAAHMDDDDLARLVASHRLLHDPTDRKHQRLGYLRRTIGIARAKTVREDLATQLEAA